MEQANCAVKHVLHFSVNAPEGCPYCPTGDFRKINSFGLMHNRCLKN